ncbi:hypothetical protein A0257_11940 [Hymenobacter psoromatis]|nr:hypothetical protein A0257_11940 [Hymenobacter psoromatis]
MNYLPLGAASLGVLRRISWLVSLSWLIIWRQAAGQALPPSKELTALRDEMQQLLAADTKQDSARVNHLNKLALALRIESPVKTWQLSVQALRLAQHLHYEQGKLSSYIDLSYSYRGRNQYDSALYCAKQAIDLADKLQNKQNMLRILYNIVRIYIYKGDYSQAYAANAKGLELAGILNEKRFKVLHTIQFGLIETELGNYEQARKYFDQASALAQGNRDYVSQAQAYGGLGDLNRQQARWSLAGYYYTKAAASYRHVYGADGLLDNEVNIAEMIDRQGDHQTALALARKLFRRATALRIDGEIARTQLLLARTFLATDQPDSARFYGASCFVKTQHDGLRPEGHEAAQLLAQANAKLKSWGAAYHYQLITTALADTLTGEATRRRIAGLQGEEAQKRQQIRLQLLQQRADLQAQQQELTRLRYRQQLTALAGLGALLLAMSGGILWRYRRRERRRQEALRTRIAADLHDEVGSMLTQISMQSTLLREGHYAPAQQQAYLEQMSEASRRAARQMSDAVWSIDARYDSAASLLDRLRDHAHEVLPPAGLELDFRADTALATATVPLATRQALYYIYKEALHNIVKHAQAQQVWVRLRLRGRQLELEVRDDGRGLPSAGRPGGQGLPNMRMRTAAVGGTITFDTTGPGTRLLVRLPLR